MTREDDSNKRQVIFSWSSSQDFVLTPFWSRMIGLPVTFLSSSSISSFPFDFGILPINKRVFGSLTLTLRGFPSSISYKSSCRGNRVIIGASLINSLNKRSFSAGFFGRTVCYCIFYKTDFGLNQSKGCDLSANFSSHQNGWLIGPLTWSNVKR